MPAKRSAESHKIEAASDQAPAPKRVRQAHVEPKPEPAPSPAKEVKASPAPKAEPAPKPVRQARAEGTAVATVPATSQPAYNPGYSGYTDQGAAGLNFATPATPPPAAPASAASVPKAQPKQMAKANPPPASAAPAQAAAEPLTPGLTKRSVILFAPQAADPAQSALGAIKFLAGDLNAAMNSASARVQIQAFGGNRGDKSSDARRLSLKRALAIRQVLIDDGVPAERIDVRAMGGADDSGPADRVDVYVKA
jgi:outer membrane protein OmpA-like peptidoglycan-associated protein